MSAFSHRQLSSPGRSHKTKYVHVVNIESLLLLWQMRRKTVIEKNAVGFCGFFCFGVHRDSFFSNLVAHLAMVTVRPIDLSLHYTPANSQALLFLTFPSILFSLVVGFS